MATPATHFQAGLTTFDRAAAEVNKRAGSEIWPERKPSEVKAAATAAAETRCRQALVELMRADPGNPIPKETLKLKFPGVGGRGFERVFAEAAEEAPAPAWRAKGRRKKAAPVIATPN